MKRGKKVPFYLQPEDQALLNMAMQEEGFTDRGPFLMWLLRQRSGVTEFRRMHSKRLLKEMDALGLSLEVMQKVKESSIG